MLARASARSWRRSGLLLLATAPLVVPTPAAAASAPIVVASVAAKDGTLIGPIAVRAKQATLKVGRHRCTVAAGTPLAALIALRAKAKRPHVGKLVVRDYGSCGKRPSSSARLYVTGIGRDRATGPDGWIYDVGGRGGSASAADPAGPFGRGRLKQRSAVSWRWCRASQDPEGDCGDVLEIGAITAELLPGTGDGTVGPLDAPTDTGTRDRTRYTVPVRLRSGATGETTGTSVAAAAGTRVELVAGRTGVTLASAAVGPGGVAVLESDASVPPDAFLVARGASGIAPAGKLLRLPRA